MDMAVGVRYRALQLHLRCPMPGGEDKDEIGEARRKMMRPTYEFAGGVDDCMEVLMLDSGMAVTR